MFGNFGLGTFAQKNSFGNFRLGTLAWDLWLGIYGLGSLAWNLWVGILGLENWYLKLGEPLGPGYGGTQPGRGQPPVFSKLYKTPLAKPS